MKTLLIYDNSGYIYMQVSGSYRTPQGGLNFLEVDSTIYENKVIKSVKVETKELILEDIPLSETELLKQKVAEQEAALIELATLVGGTK